MRMGFAGHLKGGAVALASWYSERKQLQFLVSIGRYYLFVFFSSLRVRGCNT